MRGPTVGVIATPPPAGQTHLVTDLASGLADHGCRVEMIDPDAGHLDLAALPAGADLYVLKSGTSAGLSLAGVLHARGARIINPYPVAAACRDKIVQTHMLAAAGIPVPQSWLTVEPETLLPELVGGPLILKDPRGSRGRGIEVVRDAETLRRLPAGTPYLAMRYHPPEGHDLKLYRIGSEVFAIERVFPARTLAEKVGRPYEVSPELRDLVMRCGEVFGISVYGVDVIRSRGRRWVVDMSSFPGFKGVPAAGHRIADHLVGAVA